MILLQEASAEGPAAAAFRPPYLYLGSFIGLKALLEQCHRSSSYRFGWAEPGCIIPYQSPFEADLFHEDIDSSSSNC